MESLTALTRFSHDCNIFPSISYNLGPILSEKVISESPTPDYGQSEALIDPSGEYE